MMDGSLGTDGKTPSTYDYNVDTTRHVVELAHACGVSVEGELGCLGSLESGMAGEEDGHGAEGKLSHDQLLTDPNRSRGFRQEDPRGRPGPSPSAPATAPTSSPRSPPARCCASTG